MRWFTLTLGVLALIVGTVWIFQGAGVLQGSFMTGQRFWLGVGIVLDLAGAFAVVRALRQQPGRS